MDIAQAPGGVLEESHSCWRGRRRGPGPAGLFRVVEETLNLPTDLLCPLAHDARLALRDARYVHQLPTGRGAQPGYANKARGRLPLVGALVATMLDLAGPLMKRPR